MSDPGPGVPGEAPPSAAPRLIWERADGSHVAFRLVADHVLVGRDEAVDVLVDEPLVSRLHARLERAGATYSLRDLGSTNLTRVNGEVISQPVLLRHGDEVRFARARCRYVTGDDTPEGS